MGHNPDSFIRLHFTRLPDGWQVEGPEGIQAVGASAEATLKGLVGSIAAYAEQTLYAPPPPDDGTKS